MTDNKERLALTLLAELHAQVLGECPSLLNDDSGGDGNLDLEIRSVLASASTQHPIEDNYHHFLSYSGLAHTLLLKHAYYHGAGADIENLPALAAAPATEPIYQLKSGDGRWIDQAEHSYQYNLSHGHPVRIVYTAPVAAQASEPVLYQCRTRPDWRPDGWTKWEDCTPESAGDYERTPLLHDWHYEVRRLYTAQPSAEAVRNAALEEAAKLMDPYDDKDSIGAMNAAAIRALKGVSNDK